MGVVDRSTVNLLLELQHTGSGWVKTSLGKVSEAGNSGMPRKFAVVEKTSPGPKTAVVMVETPVVVVVKKKTVSELKNPWSGRRCSSGSPHGFWVSRYSVTHQNKCQTKAKQ